MPQTQVKVELDALGLPIKFQRFTCPQAENDYIIQSKIDFDPETGTTKPNEDEKILLFPLIQSYKDQCGMECIQKQIRMGYLSPAAVADDGQHGGDADVPMDVNDAYRAQMVASQSIRDISRSLGLNITDQTTDQEIADRLKVIADSLKANNNQGGTENA